MPDILIRDVNPEVYARFALIAQRNHRSISEEVIHLIREYNAIKEAKNNESRDDLRRVGDDRTSSGLDDRGDL